MKTIILKIKFWWAKNTAAEMYCNLTRWCHITKFNSEKNFLELIEQIVVKSTIKSFMDYEKPLFLPKSFPG